jgi:uncharacterized protein
MKSDQNKVIENTITFVKNSLLFAEGGHDFWHAYRVMQVSQTIAKKENANLFICEITSLLHDIADPKFHNGDLEKGSLIAIDFLRTQNLDDDTIKSVSGIIKNISFGGGKSHPGIKSIELQVVQDADRLDAIGAIGIARAFHYGGFKNRKIYDPEIHPKSYANLEEYRKSDSPTINHFYEKLLLLKGLMNTMTGEKMAEERHRFIENYLKQFFDEWEGRK